MPTGDDPALDPQTVLRSFTTRLRGYDSDEVDSHLRSIATALRATSRDSNDDGAELEKAKTKVHELSLELAKTRSRLTELEEAADGHAAGDEHDGPDTVEEPFDEHRAMQLLGEETTRVLETARQSAANIVARAEADAKERTDTVDAMQAKVNTELAEARKQADTELAELRARQDDELEEARRAAEAEIEERLAAVKERIARQEQEADDEAERLVSEATAKAAELESSASEVSAAAEKDAAAAIAAARAEAAELRKTAETEAATARAEAETEAARMRAEAEADALAAQESARETARLMVVEAQRVREKVLSDLVVRRRQGRQQVDQAKAARDRLARALQDVRSQLDASVRELDVALPEAKAAMTALSTPEAPTDDAAQIRELEAELDAATEKAGRPAPVVAMGSAALAPARRNKPAPAPDAADTSDDAVTKTTADPEPTESESPETAASEESTAKAESTPAADPTEVVDATDGETDGETDGVSDGEAEAEEEAIEVPEPFRARDVAMTRHGADLRRKLKRVMADEQSDLLDRLQRSKAMSVDDLASADEQRQRYVDAVAPALRAVATLGGQLQGGDVGDALVDDLVARLVAEVFDPLRGRVEDSVAAAADVDEVLEPLRAHYRDVRLSDVPGLTDDALAEAFALGAYSAIPIGTPVRWISDPRFQPSSDCFDDTLADDVVKPDGFPTGRTHPTGQPGCRCLVLPAD